MDKSEAVVAIKRVIKRELDDCERALTRGDVQSAKSELDDAVSKLKRIIRAMS